MTGENARDDWLAIEMRHLTALASVGRESSFSGAADSLGYVQSAVSQQVAYLERVVGRRLVERSGRGRGVTLTDAGAVLVDHIEAILDQLRLAKKEIEALTQGSREAADFGIPAVFGSWLPTAVLGALLAGGRRPWGRLERASSSQLLDGVATGRLDAAFVELPIPWGPFFAMELLSEPCILVFPAEPLAADQTVQAVLQRWPLVAVDDCRATRALLIRLAGKAQGMLTGHAVESPASALSFVRAGAAAVMTARDLPDDDESLATIALPGVPRRVVGLAWHRDRDDCAVVGALRRAAREAFDEPRIE